MKLNFERSGGFAGLTFRASVDTANLSTEEQENIQTLVDKCSKLNLGKFNAELADGHQYKLEMNNNGQAQTIQTDDSNLPDELDELFNLVIKLSKK